MARLTAYCQAYTEWFTTQYLALIEVLTALNDPAPGQQTRTLLLDRFTDGEYPPIEERIAPSAQPAGSTISFDLPEPVFYSCHPALTDRYKDGGSRWATRSGYTATNARSSWGCGVTHRRR